MEQKLRIAVYGDSLMKGTLPDEQLRYHFHTDLFEAPLAGVDAKVTNKSVFARPRARASRSCSATSRAATAMTGRSSSMAATTATMTGQTWPPTPSSTMTPWCWRMNSAQISRPSCRCCVGAGVRPIFTTLPPIDEVKYLACIDHNGASAAGVMQWLGDVRRIYRTQERYSGLVCTIAAELDVPCVDPARAFSRRGRSAREQCRGRHPPVRGRL